METPVCVLERGKKRSHRPPGRQSLRKDDVKVLRRIIYYHSSAAEWRNEGKEDIYLFIYYYYYEDDKGKRWSIEVIVECPAISRNRVQSVVALRDERRIRRAAAAAAARLFSFKK